MSNLAIVHTIKATIEFSYDVTRSFELQMFYYVTERKKENMRGIKKEKLRSIPPTILFSNLQKSHSGTQRIRINHLLLNFGVFLRLNILQTFL
jgi:hypothetical protein